MSQLILDKLLDLAFKAGYDTKESKIIRRSDQSPACENLAPMGQPRALPVPSLTEIASMRQQEIARKKEESVKVQKLREVAVASYIPPVDSSIPSTVPVDLDRAKKNNELIAFATDS